MTDVERLVRQALQDHEVDVPLLDPLEIRPMAARTRRRQIRNAIGAGLIAVAITVAAAGGVGAILRAERHRPADLPSPAPSPPGPAFVPVAFPPAGVGPSTPLTGEVVISVSAEDVAEIHVDDGDHLEVIEIAVYADGRVIWSRCGEWLPYRVHDFAGPDEGCVSAPDASGLSTGWVQQVLTREAVNDLRDELLATGLFEGGGTAAETDGSSLIEYLRVGVRDGDRMREVNAQYPGVIQFNPPSPRQLAGLQHLQEVLLDLEAWFPETAWVDREAVPFVPSSYSFWSKEGTEKALLRDARVEVSQLEPGDLPAPADHLLTRDDCDVVTLEEARAILEGFEAAGISTDPERTRGTTMMFLVRGGEEGLAVYFEPNPPGSSPSC